MKKLTPMLVALVLCLGFAFPASAADSILKDYNNATVYVFQPDPAKSQVNSSMTGTLTFKKGTGASVDITGWTVIKVDPTADGTWYFNSDSTKTWPLRSGSDNYIPVKRLAIGESVVLVLGSATASVQGM